MFSSIPLQASPVGCGGRSPQPHGEAEHREALSLSSPPRRMGPATHGLTLPGPKRERLWIFTGVKEPRGSLADSAHPAIKEPRDPSGAPSASTPGAPVPRQHLLEQAEKAQVCRAERPLLGRRVQQAGECLKAEPGSVCTSASRARRSGSELKAAGSPLPASVLPFPQVGSARRDALS